MERRIRKDKDENQWERVVKRAAEGNKGIKRAVAKKVLRAYGRLSKRDVGSGTKWGRVMKMDNLKDFDQPLKDLNMVDYKLAIFSVI